MNSSSSFINKTHQSSLKNAHGHYDSQYSNLNLNGSNKYSTLSPEYSIKKSSKNRRTSFGLADFSDNIGRGNSQAWNKSTTFVQNSSFMPSRNNYVAEEKVRSRQNEDNVNSSTLSIHIKKYDMSSEDGTVSKDGKKRETSSSLKSFIAGPSSVTVIYAKNLHFLKIFLL